MTKKQAIERLILDFQNRLIAFGYDNTENIEDDLDKEMAKALKIDWQKI